MTERETIAILSEVESAANIVRGSFGPFGTYKFFVCEDGTVIITDSGAEILDRFEVESAPISVLRGAVRDLNAELSDGAGTFAVLVGALAGRAADLLERGLYQANIERGYQIAASVALETLVRSRSPVAAGDRAALASTALTGTKNQIIREQLGETIAGVAAEVAASEGVFNRHALKIVSHHGGAHGETETIQGAILDASPVVESMPRQISSTRVALVSTSIDVRQFGESGGETSANVRLSEDSFENRLALGQQEREEFAESIRRVVASGCRFVATSGAVNDRVKTVLANQRLLAVQRIDESDLTHIARITGAESVPSLDYVTEQSLGSGDITVDRKAGRDMTFIENPDGPPVYTLFCRAPDRRHLQTFERSVESAVAAVAMADADGGLVPGGGASEQAAARAIQAHARSISGREQLAVEAFGDALRAVPVTLAENSGMDTIEAVADLQKNHSEGSDTHGIDCIEGYIRDMLAEPRIVDPYTKKRQVWSSAIELVTRLIRVSDVLPAVKRD